MKWHLDIVFSSALLPLLWAPVCIWERRLRHVLSQYLVKAMPHTGKKTVLVTGGAGFIGSWVADTLLARGDDVVIVDEVRRQFVHSCSPLSLSR